MVIVRFPELLKWNDLRNDWAIEFFLRLRLGLLSRGLFSGSLIKYNRSILRSHVIALPIQRGGIVHFPECVQKLLVRYHPGIIFDLDDFGVPGSSGANLFVSGAWLGAASESTGDRFHPRQHLVNGFGAPIAPPANYRALCMICR